MIFSKLYSKVALARAKKEGIWIYDFKSLWSICLRKYLNYSLWLCKYLLYLTCNCVPENKHDMLRDLNHR